MKIETSELVRPEGLTNEHLEFLDELRESGITNMFGATPYLVQSFTDLSNETARSYLSYWMETFGNENR